MSRFKQRMTKRKWRWLVYLVVLTPLWMYCWWLISPTREMPTLILDKTVLNKKCQEHLSANWVLNSLKFSKKNGDIPAVDKDYIGFFPEENEVFSTRSVGDFSPAQQDSLLHANKVFYYTDTYGIYENEWFQDRDPNERSKLLYGGMTMPEVDLLVEAKQHDKLIVTEFNIIASPTPGNVRRKFERNFDLKWTGWVGRYFEVLDTTKNHELPRWLTTNYLEQHDNKWPFTTDGIVFVSEDDRIEILDGEADLELSVPVIITADSIADKWGLSDSVKYPFWFDIMACGPAHHLISEYHLHVTPSGKRLLDSIGVPVQFSAVTSQTQDDFRFYYFSGDFADNPVTMTSSYLKGVGFFKSWLYQGGYTAERASFFWEYYRPLLSNILITEYDRVQ